MKVESGERNAGTGSGCGQFGRIGRFVCVGSRDIAGTHEVACPIELV